MLDLLGAALHSLHMVVDHSAGLGHRDAGRGTNKQFGVEPGFQIIDPPRDGGLTYAQGAPSGREAPGLDHGPENPKIGPIGSLPAKFGSQIFFMHRGHAETPGVRHRKVDHELPKGKSWDPRCIALIQN